MGPQRASALSSWSALLFVLVLVGACSPLATKGTMPPPGPDGDADVERAPDFIAVAGRHDSIAGYVPKEFLFPEPTTTVGLPVEQDYPVYAEDLRTLIGHMVAGRASCRSALTRGRSRSSRSSRVRHSPHRPASRHR
jgi:hypothetical protein